MRKTLALLTAAAALAASAQSAIACDSPQPVAKPLDRHPSVAMPRCPDCRYHLLDTRS
jgi:hypothetical protein